jgi:hypothetical protein
MRWVNNLFRELILLSFSILFNPIMEAFIHIFKCEGDYHMTATSLACYSGLHIFLMIMSVLFALLFFLITFFFMIFQTEIDPLPDYALAKISDSCEIALVLYRVVIIIYATFVSGVLLSLPLGNCQLDSSLRLSITWHDNGLPILCLHHLL